ncbi:hypothetical protein Tsubulata_030015 [Turnera subulata]|uniref:Phytocyanin domain-containing protein n=1 Tax=Turnera subulata TaxID=218843 RepID=A0A9Q0F9N4_9ROSI|nr:hypothetical protein Tsubulata_030015 [Turnera subulata]
MVSAVKKKMLVALVIISVMQQWVAAQVHHVVGGDRGWDPETDLASWSSGRTFRVGDKIWFTYSAAQERVAELLTEEEYKSCDVGNPIRMYTDGIDRISLEKEGIRYFASSNADNCKKGLKLHVEVGPPEAADVPKVVESEGSGSVAADGPKPSTSAHISPDLAFLVAGFFWLWYAGF